jgi:hypothetical protein
MIVYWLTSLQSAIRDQWTESATLPQFQAFNGGSRKGRELFREFGALLG